MASGDNCNQTSGHSRASTLMVAMVVAFLGSACASTAPMVRSSPVTTALPTPTPMLGADAPPSVAAAGWIAVSANAWDVGDGENGDIYLLSKGAAPRRIIGSDRDGIAQACPAFSPNGKLLAYGEATASGIVTSHRGVWPVSDRAVVVVGLSANGDPSRPLMRVTLPSNPGEIACPRWSPNGRDVAFRVGADLWVADTTSGKTTVFQVGATPWGQQGFAWSRDGSRIAVAEPGEIRVVPIDGSTPRLIRIQGAFPGSFTGSMAWTADDDAIVYVDTVPQGDELTVNRVDSDGTHDTPLAGGGRAEVSPDGSRVAYITSVSGTFNGLPNDEHVMTMDTSGGHVVEVRVPPGFLLEGLLWSPDGRRLLLSSIDGAISVALTPGSPPIVYATGTYLSGLDLEWSWSEVTWQPLTGPTS